MRRLKHYLWMLLALGFLGASWIWEIVRPPIQWVIDLIPLDGLKRAVARFLEGLPPYPTLLIFLIPVIALEPGKVVALWFFAKGQWPLGIATYVATDVIRLGIVSFLFNTCKEKLLSIAWFARLYKWFVWAHEWAHHQIAPLKAAIRRGLEEAGLLNSRGALLRKIVALWKFTRRGGLRNV